MVFGITIDYLVNGTVNEKAENVLTDARFLSLFKEVESMPERDREVIFTLIEAFTIKKQMESLLESKN